LKFGRLSHNLPRLAVAGNKIVIKDTGRPVLLRGVNLSGLEYSSPDGATALTQAQIDEAVLAEITRNWNANIIRLPLNQSWALEREGYDPTSYRQALELVIETAAKLGAYTLVDLQWLNATKPRGIVNGKNNYVPPLPDPDSIALWRQLSEQWRDESAILYDIFTEPHDPLPVDAEPLYGIRADQSTFPLSIRKVTAGEWLPWARHLISAIRGQIADAVIFVSGTNWGYDLRDCVMPDVPNLVYSTHAYAWKGHNWNRAFGHLAASVPLFASEWGGTDDDLDWGTTLANYFNTHEMGWTAWSWSDQPRLIEYPSEPPFRPTPFGSLVRERLRNGLT
jgi:endoglucanase